MDAVAPVVPHRQVEHDFPDSGGTVDVAMTGSMLISERDLGRNRATRKRRLPFGFQAPAYVAGHYGRARNRHWGSVARRG